MPTIWARAAASSSPSKSESPGICRSISSTSPAAVLCQLLGSRLRRASAWTTRAITPISAPARKERQKTDWWGCWERCCSAAAGRFDDMAFQILDGVDANRSNQAPDGRLAANSRPAKGEECRRHGWILALRPAEEQTSLDL